MYINLNFCRHATSFIENSVLPSLTAQHKKILLVASIALSCLAMYYVIRRCWNFKPLNSDEKKTPENGNAKEQLNENQLPVDEKGKTKEVGESVLKPEEVKDGDLKGKPEERQSPVDAKEKTKEVGESVLKPEEVKDGDLKGKPEERQSPVDAKEKIEVSEVDLSNPQEVNPKIAIGKKEWEKYFGDVGEVPPLPKDIHKILESPCPFFPGKKIEETHMLVLIPETVDGKPLTLDTLGELVKAPKEGKATSFRYIWDDIIRKYGNQAITKAHWALMTRNVIEGSRNKSYTDQQALIAESNKRTGMNYEVPNALDAAICIFMHYISSGERLFNDALLTYTRCEEDVRGWQIIVGGFSPAGLDVDNVNFDYDFIGVAALRKF